MDITGAAAMRKVGADLSAAGSGGRRLRSRMRRNIVTATAPIEKDARSGFEAYGPGLGAALAAATRTQVRATGSSASVTVRIDASRMPAEKQGLPPLVEGFRPWRHQAWGRGKWYPQAAHPELGPAVEHHLPGVQAGVIAAVDETAAALARGSA